MKKTLQPIDRKVLVMRHNIVWNQSAKERLFLGNGELGVLGFLGRSRAFLALCGWRRRRGLFQAAGCDLRPRLLSFEDGDFIAQLLHGIFKFTNPVLLRANDREQRFDQRCPLVRWNFRMCRESVRHAS